MKKKLLVGCCLLMALIMAFSMTACGGKDNKDGDTSSTTTSEQKSNSQEAKDVTITLWHIWPSESDAIGKVLTNVMADWQSKNPKIKIQAEATEALAYQQKLRTSIAANEFADVFFSWGAGYSRPFVSTGKVLPLDEYLNDGTLDRLIGGALSNLTYDGKIYGLPYTQAVAALYCNKELFDNNGIKIPETYNELLEAVKSFNSKGIVPLGVGEKDKWPGMFYYNILALREGGAQLNNDAVNKLASFNQPAFINAAAKLDELVKAGAFDKGAMGMTRDESEAEFMQGKIAMYYNGSWAAGMFESEDSPLKGKVVAAKFPAIDGGQGNINEFLGGSVDTFMVNSGTKNKDEAAKIVKFITENMSREGYLAGIGLPVWKAEFDSSKVNPLVAQIADLIKDATGFTLWWDVYLEGQDAETHKNLVQEIYAGLITPEKFAAEMQKLNEGK